MAGYDGAFISTFDYFFLFFENALETVVVIIPYLKKKKKKKGTTNKQKVLDKVMIGIHSMQKKKSQMSFPILIKFQTK